MQYVVKARGTDQIIASGEENEGMHIFEGNLYFNPAAVDMTDLHMTERTYTCPYKGVCYWFDLENDNGRAQNVAWVYQDPKPGYEHIRGQIAFYSRETTGTTVERVSDAA